MSSRLASRLARYVRPENSGVQVPRVGRVSYPPCLHLPRFPWCAVLSYFVDRPDIPSEILVVSRRRHYCVRLFAVKLHSLPAFHRSEFADHSRCLLRGQSVHHPSVDVKRVSSAQKPQVIPLLRRRPGRSIAPSHLRRPGLCELGYFCQRVVKGHEPRKPQHAACIATEGRSNPLGLRLITLCVALDSVVQVGAKRRSLHSNQSRYVCNRDFRCHGVVPSFVLDQPLMGQPDVLDSNSATAEKSNVHSHLTSRRARSVQPLSDIIGIVRLSKKFLHPERILLCLP